MKQTEFSWFGSDGKKVYGRIWQPESANKLSMSRSETKAVICLVHGMGEHSGRYEHFAQFFTNNGYSIITFDHRGHGKSEGLRGHVSSYQVLLDQVDKALEESSKRFPGEPKFIYGHSMGGNVVINHALSRNPRVLGVVASAPWLRLNVEVPKGKLLLAKIMANVWGRYRETSTLDSTDLSRDPAVAEAYDADPLVHRKISTKMFFSCYEHGEQAIADAPQLHMDMLLMHGTEDKITNYEASEEFVRNANDDMVSFKSWEGFYHELHNEPEQKEVFQYVLDWFEDKLAASTSVSVA